MRLIPLWLCLISCGSITAVSQEAWSQPATPVKMQHEILRLNERIKELENQLHGKAAPINLGRTSLATVSASSVNGNRELSNPFYGILNAFDNGENWKNRINYTHWLTDSQPAHWVEIAFDEPVTVTSISVDNGPAFSSQLFVAAGGEETFKETTSQLALPQPIRGVTKVRLNFGGEMKPMKVDEIRIMGYVPPGTPYKIAAPRILMTKTNAASVAQNAFELWRMAQFKYNTPPVFEEGNSYLITFRDDTRGLDLFRVTINKQTSEVTTESLVNLVPAQKNELPISQSAAKE